MGLLEQPLNDQDWADLGSHFAGSGQWPKALHCFRMVGASEPEKFVKQAQALINIGTPRSLDAAEAICLALGQHWSRHPESLWVRGALLMHRGLFDDAVGLFLEAHAEDEFELRYLTDAALALQYKGDYELAGELYQKAISINPLAASVKTWYGMLLMLTGDTANGLDWYESRALHDMPIPPNGKPTWNGEPLAGKTLAIYQEQGIGDAVQFIRYASTAKRLWGAKSVIAVVRDPLYRLLCCADGVDRVAIRGGVVPEYDYHIRMMSLYRVAYAAMGEHTWPGAYIHVPAMRRGARPRVGLCWKGAAEHANDKYRSMEFAQMELLLDVPGVDYVSLQYGHPFSREGIERPVFTDIYSLARVVSSCDLVVTVDTATAHVAGAMGVQCLVLLPQHPDWRWGLTNNARAWYPTVRLIRCQETLAWRPVIEKAREAICSCVRSASQAG